MNLLSMAPLRTHEVTIRALQLFQKISNNSEDGDKVSTNRSSASLRTSADSILHQLSTTNRLPALVEHSPSSVYSLYPYQFSRYEPLHKFHLRMTKMLLVFMHERVRNFLEHDNVY